MEKTQIILMVLYASEMPSLHVVLHKITIFMDSIGDTVLWHHLF